MKKLGKIGILLVVFVLGLYHTSCFNTEEEVPRTQAMELQELNTYINNLLNLNYDVDTTDLGVYYVIKEAGEGPFPQHGDTLTISYSGFFVNGNLFETTASLDNEGSYTFNYIDDAMIPGFEDGIKLMNKGTLLEMIIPSTLAYGALGNVYIPQYTSLIFVVRMKDLKPFVND